MISESGERGQSDVRTVVGGWAGRGAESERERSRPSWGRTRRACAARKQTAGWIFVFTFHVVIALRRVILHDNNTILIKRAAHYDVIVLYMLVIF